MTDQTFQDKIILDLCGGTGAWSKPYKDAGYDVRLAPPYTEFSYAKQIRSDSGRQTWWVYTVRVT